MTAKEIVKSSNNQSWQEKSIYIILNSLLKKGVITTGHIKTLKTNNAGTYVPTITPEDSVLSHMAAMEEAGVHIDIPTLVESLIKKSKG